MSGKNLVLKLNAKIVSANQIAGFSNFIWKTIAGIKLFFACRYISIKATNWWCDFSWTKDAIKTKVSKAREDVKLILCMQLHIFY